MILADTTVWADHINRRDELLSEMLLARQIVMHPFVAGEILLGNPPDRQRWRREFEKLVQLLPFRHGDLMMLIEDDRMFGSGIGYVDAHLLASVRATAGCLLWTRDKKLRRAAQRFDVMADLT